MKCRLHTLCPLFGSQSLRQIAFIHKFLFAVSLTGILKKLSAVPGSCLLVQLITQQLLGIFEASKSVISFTKDQ